MRDFARNKRQLWYANMVSEEPVTDEWGYETGETNVVYEEPVLAAYNVSGASGEAAAEAFGAFTDYSRTISTCDKQHPFKIGTRVWFGVNPPSGHNYVVSKVADSLNSVLVALKEVTT